MKFMHLSNVELEVGDSIEPQDDGYCHYPESQALEELLERYRPEGKIARKESVFLFSRRNGNSDFGADGSDYLFVVDCDPDTSNQASDLNWIFEIDMGFENIEELEEDYTEEELRELAEGYWSGKERHGNNTGVFEYRAYSGKISAIYDFEKLCSKEKGVEVSIDNK